MSTHVIHDVKDAVRETDRFTVVREHGGMPVQITEEEDPWSG
ncbi:MAG: hypothetical protein ACRDH7_03100 [Actinomycetota bacterium]